MNKMKEIKDQIIKDQKLFDIPISKYDQLTAVDDRLTFMGSIYSIYRE